MNNAVKKIQADLFSMKDDGYRDFNSALIPNISKECFMGVRTPALRAYAKKLFKSSPEAVDEFLSDLPHSYFEEKQLHGFLIEQIMDYDKCIATLGAFLPYVDNWSTCDSMNPKALKKDLPALLTAAKKWINSPHEYTCRYGIGILMRYFLDEEFKPEYPALVADIRREEYYVKMMVAWYFATALAKQYNEAIVYIEQQKLEPWTHNKSIQKAIESYRVRAENKEYLKSLKIKKLVSR